MGLLIRTPFSSEAVMLDEKLSPSFYHVYFYAHKHTQNIRTFPSISVRISGIFQNLSEKKKQQLFRTHKGLLLPPHERRNKLKGSLNAVSA